MKQGDIVRLLAYTEWHAVENTGCDIFQKGSCFELTVLTENGQYAEEARSLRTGKRYRGLGYVVDNFEPLP